MAEPVLHLGSAYLRYPYSWDGLLIYEDDNHCQTTCLSSGTYRNHGLLAFYGSAPLDAGRHDCPFSPPSSRMKIELLAKSRHQMPILRT